MPKETYQINRFDGGINEASDPRDIAENQMQSCVGFDISQVGVLKMLGGFEDATEYGAVIAVIGAWGVYGGEGLIAFSSDYTDARDAIGGAAAVESSTNYLGIYSERHSKVLLWESTEGAGFEAAIDPGANSNNPTLYMADGGLRFIDGQFNAESGPEILTPVVRSDFPGTNGEYDWSTWYSGDITLTAPTVSNGSWIAYIPAHPSPVYEGFLTGFNADHPFVALEWLIADGSGGTAEGGTWSNIDNYEIYQSYLYIGMQESPLTKLNYNTGSTRPVGAAFRSTFNIHVRVNTETGGGSENNFGEQAQGPIIIGTRLYFQETGTELSTERFLLWEGIWEKGYRFADSLGDYTAWGNATLSGSGGAVDYATAINEIVYPDPFDVETYRTLNGYDAGEDIVARFRTAAIANRCVYAGNVKQGGVVYGDRILKSPPNKFDTFPESRYLDVTVNDGDEIIHLAEYGDRLLQFKAKSVTIINIAQGQEFLEATYNYMGVKHWSGVAKTDFGIVWASEEGVFLYDGRKIDNLLERNGLRLISRTTWSNWVKLDGPMVGYAPKYNKIIVTPSKVSGTNKDAYIYDTVIKGWTKSQLGSLFPDTDISNFTIDHNADLIYCFGPFTVDGSPMKWTDEANASTCEYISKDIDFGSPGRRKKIYKVYITYASGSTIPTPNYGVNGGDPDLTFKSSYNAFTASQDVGTRVELRPESDAKSVYSFQLKISGTATSAAFQINDISIVYRNKSIR